MNSKTLILVTSLLFGSTLGLAQSTAEPAGSRTVAQSDTLYTFTEDQLSILLKRVAEAASQREDRPTTINSSSEELRLVKLLLLLQSLGSGDAAAATGSVVAVAPPTRMGQPQPVQPLNLSTQRYDDVRLDRLERLLLLLAERSDRNYGAQPVSPQPVVVSPGRSSQDVQLLPMPLQQGNSAQTDSLIKLLHNELITLRAQQAQTLIQPLQAVQPIVSQPLQANPVEAPAPAVEAPAEPVEVQPEPQAVPAQTIVERDTVVADYFKRQVFFAVGQSKLLPEARLTLNEVYRIMEQNPQMKLTLTGYASTDGSQKRNQALSEQRSRVVLAYLTSCGISEDRLNVVSGGVDGQTDLPTLARRVDLEIR